MARIISIVSLDKNSGKTTLALNLGLALHERNNRVLVLDADFTKKNMLEHLGIGEPEMSIRHVLEGNAHINDATYKHVSGMRIIPSGIHTYGRLAYYFEDLLPGYDFIILDTPSDKSALKDVAAIKGEAIIVHSPENSSRSIAEAARFIRKARITLLGIVLNNSASGSASSMFGYPVLANIKTSQNIERSFSLKSPLLYIYPKSDASQTIRKLAEIIT